LGIPHPPRDSHFPTAATTNFRLHFQCLDNPTYGYILKWLDRGTQGLGQGNSGRLRKEKLAIYRCPFIGSILTAPSFDPGKPLLSGFLPIFAFYQSVKLPCTCLPLEPTSAYA
jgi:hypothetical protein